MNIPASVCGFVFVWMCLHDCACVDLPAFCLFPVARYQESCNCVFSAAVSCGSAPDAPANGQRSVSGTSFESTVTYTCNRGYTLQGDSGRTCMANGQWSGRTPTCSGTLNSTVCNQMTQHLLTMGI